jgi:hypothetical protein
MLFHYRNCASLPWYLKQQSGHGFLDLAPLCSLAPRCSREIFLSSLCSVAYGVLE